MNHSRYIPEDIVRNNILSSLPIMSRFRFKCVSKQWNCLISETTIPNQKLLFLSYRDDQNSVTRRTIDQTGTIEDVSIQFDKTYESGSYRYRILGSCNGLLLVSIGMDLYLCNMTTRVIARVLSSKYLNKYEYTTVAGLCFDSINDDYVVVMAVSHKVRPYHDFVQVGTRKSSWKNIYFPYDIDSIDPGVTLNHRLHWLAEEADDGQSYFEHDVHSPSNRIIYFDLKSYAFVELPTPETKGVPIESVGVLRDCLCMTCHTNIEVYPRDVEVWIMKEYGVEESWSPLFKFQESDGDLSLLAPCFYTRKENEVIMRVSISYSKHVASYDTQRKVFTDVMIPVDYWETNIVYDETVVDPSSYGYAIPEKTLKSEGKCPFAKLFSRQVV